MVVITESELGSYPVSLVSGGRLKKAASTIFTEKEDFLL
jgi:hypothetical protein